MDPCWFEVFVKRFQKGATNESIFLTDDQVAKKHSPGSVYIHGEFLLHPVFGCTDNLEDAAIRMRDMLLAYRGYGADEFCLVLERASIETGVCENVGYNPEGFSETEIALHHRLLFPVTSEFPEGPRMICTRFYMREFIRHLLYRTVELLLKFHAEELSWVKRLYVPGIIRNYDYTACYNTPDFIHEYEDFEVTFHGRPEFSLLPPLRYFPAHLERPRQQIPEYLCVLLLYLKMKQLPPVSFNHTLICTDDVNYIPVLLLFLSCAETYFGVSGTLETDVLIKHSDTGDCISLLRLMQSIRFHMTRAFPLLLHPIKTLVILMAMTGSKYSETLMVAQEENAWFKLNGHTTLKAFGSFYRSLAKEDHPLWWRFSFFSVPPDERNEPDVFFLANTDHPDPEVIAAFLQYMEASPLKQKLSTLDYKLLALRIQLHYCTILNSPRFQMLNDIHYRTPSEPGFGIEVTRRMQWHFALVPVYTQKDI